MWYVAGCIVSSSLRVGWAFIRSQDRFVRAKDSLGPCYIIPGMYAAGICADTLPGGVRPSVTTVTKKHSRMHACGCLRYSSFVRVRISIV